MVHDEEGKPCEGVKISLYQVAKDQGGPVLEINEISTANGLAVNRSLPYGHYALSARTSDGWVLHHGSRLNVEFEKGLDVVLVAPTANKIAKLVINSDLGPPSAAINELRFGELQEATGQVIHRLMRQNQWRSRLMERPQRPRKVRHLKA